MQHGETIVKSEQAQAVGAAEQLGHIGRYPDGLATERSHSRGRSRGSAAIKRGLDIAFSITAVVVLAPAIAVISLMIKLDSPGPLLFKQKRIGRYGNPFGMFKFRTMVDGADANKCNVLHLNEREGLFKINGDPRVTRVGRFLRSTSLDELPQLINVLRGEMSIVGPRPLISEEDEQITGQLRRRLEIRPGMTGPWQTTVTSVPLQAMAAMDSEYVDQRSFLGDVVLILRTIPHVVMRRGL